MGKKNVDRTALPPIPAALPHPIVDAHTHLDACGAKTPEQVRAMVDRAASAGVTRLVTVADDLASAEFAVTAANWDERVFAAVALHPTRTAAFTEADQKILEGLAAQPKVVAIGETGLDYYWDYSPPAAQKLAFAWHIDLAKRTGKPLMIHDREAHEDVLDMLRSEGAPDTVIFHSFSGDADFARRCADLGYNLSFSGTVTFRNAVDQQEAARIVPVDQFLVETDAPFLTPHPYRGRPNEPYTSTYTLLHLAQLRNADLGEFAAQACRNAERIFALPPTSDL